MLAIRRGSGEERTRWLIYTYLLCAAALASLFVFRWAATASIISVAGAAFLCSVAFERARSISLMPVRVFATAASFFIIGPAYAVPVSFAPPSRPLEHAVASYGQCVQRSEAAKLAALPTGTIAAPLDITPSILVNTPHRAIASGHHRGAGAMADVIRLFVLPAEQGRRILDGRRADYLVFCPGAPEAVRYANHSPAGLSAMLRAGKAPAWLEPVALPGLRALRVWRVRRG